MQAVKPLVRAGNPGCRASRRTLGGVLSVLAFLVQIVTGPVAEASADATVVANSAGGAVADTHLREPYLPDILQAQTSAVPPGPIAVVPAASPELNSDHSIPVFLGDQELVRLRAHRSGMSSQDRARAVRRRLDILVNDRTVLADSAHAVVTPEGVEYWLGDHFLWILTPMDVGGRTGTLPQVDLAELTTRLHAGLTAEREARQPRALLRGIGISVAATLAAWMLWVLLDLFAMKWGSSLVRRFSRHFPILRFRNFDVLNRARFVALSTGLLGWLQLGARLLLLYLWLTVVLRLFPWTEESGRQLGQFAVTHLSRILSGAARAIPGLFVVALIVVVFRRLNSLSNRFFQAVGNGRLTFQSFHPELAETSRRLVQVLLVLLALVLAFPFLPGTESRAVQGITVLLGLMVSLGSGSVVGNILSGLVLTYTRAFRPGDRIRVGDHVGDVVNLGFFSTKVRSLRNEELTVPNSQLAGGVIVNFTRMAVERGLELHTTVTIGYDTNWRTIHALLIEAARRVEGIEGDPAPYVLQKALNDYNVCYELCAFTRDAAGQRKIQSDLHAEIQDAFARAGVEILSPAYATLRRGATTVLPEGAIDTAKDAGLRGEAPGE